MRLFNIRLGHACNSSSSHSIVMLAPGQEVGTDAIAPATAGSELYYSEDRFQLWSASSKIGYLTGLLSHSAAGLNMTKQEVKQLASVMLLEDPDKHSVAGDAAFPLPTVFNRQALNLVFLQELKFWLMQENVGILGGSDNDPLPGDYPHDHLKLAAFWQDMVARKDTDGETFWWTLFNPANGNKIKFSFDNALASQPDIAPVRNLVPELVDLKITGSCPFARDCGWCYMGSDETGQHAERHKITMILRNLANAGVFEVALGGGEPTLHPDFIDILKSGHDHKINMNFTTKNFAYFTQRSKQQWRADINEYASAVAFSVNSQRDFDRFKRAVEVYRDEWSQRVYDRGEVNIEYTMQCIPAVCDQQLLEEMIVWSDENQVRLIMLGFKYTGRGEEYQQMDNTVWLDILARLRAQDDVYDFYEAAVDTVMAQDCQQRFAELDVPPVWYHTAEGAFSCYIDATTMKLGASSFVSDEEMIVLAAYPDSDDLLATYRQMQTANAL